MGAGGADLEDDVRELLLDPGLSLGSPARWHIQSAVDIGGDMVESVAFGVVVELIAAHRHVGAPLQLQQAAGCELFVEHSGLVEEGLRPSAWSEASDYLSFGMVRSVGLPFLGSPSLSG